MQDALSPPNPVGPRRAGSTAPRANIPPEAAPPTQPPTQPVSALAAPAPAAGGLIREVAEEPAGAGDSPQEDAADYSNIPVGEFITSRCDREHACQKLLALDGSAKSVMDKTGVRFNLISIVKDHSIVFI